MYIHEAIQATKDDPRKGVCVRRKCWPYSPVKWTGAKIVPLDTPSGCIAISPNINDEKWTPSAADLVADDWVVCF